MPLGFAKKPSTAAPSAPTPVEEKEPFYEKIRGQAVGDSADLRRILALPRRERPSDAELKIIADDLKRRLGKPAPLKRADGLCPLCAPRRCCGELLPVQAWALHEAERVGGILGPIGVGHGKTLLDMLTPMVTGARRAVLLLPPNLKRQFLEVDWKFYGNHWQLPNLSGSSVYIPGRPFLYVVAFTELSGAKSTTLLEGLKPDTIIIDEAHNVRNKTAARTKRFLRYLKDAKNVRLFAWSGTLTSRSLHDYGHLSTHALAEGSPLPNSFPALEEWASALDPSDFPSPPGRLLQLGDSGDVRERFRTRLVGTSGVVSSGDAASCQASLVISERKVTTPEVIKKHIADLEGSWQRPDGEELVDALSKARCARELSCGFYYRWRWPRGEPVPVIERWLAARKEWRKELREKLKKGGAHMDSPLLVTRAAIRWHEGYTHVERDRDGNELRRFRVDPHTRNGPQPTWDSEHWLPWKEVHDSAKPETEAVWLDDFLVEDSLAWLEQGPGLLWYEFAGMARRLGEVAARSGQRLAHAGPGDEGNRLVLALGGSEHVVSSIRAHGTGKNLQQFSRNLVANPPSDGATWEQLIGRTFRAGQKADEVNFDVYRHTGAFRDAIDNARDLAGYIQHTTGANQKLVHLATWLFDDGLEDKLRASLELKR